MTTITMRPTSIRIRTLLHDFATARGCTLSYAGLLLANDGKFAARMNAGSNVSDETAEKIRKRARLYWPANRPLPSWLE